MVLSVEIRFGQTLTTQIIQWLSDRGSIYRSKETQQIGRQLGLDPCFTAASRPESNGMADAFVKTFKRDFVYTHDCPFADQVIAQLGPWFKDYIHSPHSELDYKSPIDYQLLTNKSVN